MSKDLLEGMLRVHAPDAIRLARMDPVKPAPIGPTPFKPGDRVIVEDRPGTVLRDAGHLVFIRFDEAKQAQHGIERGSVRAEKDLT